MLLLDLQVWSQADIFFFFLIIFDNLVSTTSQMLPWQHLDFLEINQVVLRRK